MKKRSIFSGALLGAAVLVLLGGALAWGAPGRWRSGEPSFRAELFRAVNPLDFSEEQWTKADGILGNLREQKWTAARVLFGLRGEVRSLFSGGEPFDGKKAGEALSAARPELVKMAEGALRAAADLYGMLDEKQLAKAENILSLLEKRAEQRIADFPGKRHDFRHDLLKLTEEQRKKAESLFTAEAPAMQERMGRLLAVLKEGRAALRDGKMNDEMIGKTAEKAVDILSEGALAMAGTYGEFRGMLTPEQLEKADRMWSRHGRRPRK
jgi:Spy/CpxP family protein refolding chaperone